MSQTVTFLTLIFYLTQVSRKSYQVGSAVTIFCSTMGTVNGPLLIFGSLMCALLGPYCIRTIPLYYYLPFTFAQQQPMMGRLASFSLSDFQSRLFCVAEKPTFFSISLIYQPLLYLVWPGMLKAGLHNCQQHGVRCNSHSWGNIDWLAHRQVSNRLPHGAFCVAWSKHSLS